MSPGFSGIVTGRRRQSKRRRFTFPTPIPCCAPFRCTEAPSSPQTRHQKKPSFLLSIRAVDGSETARRRVSHVTSFCVCKSEVKWCAEGCSCRHAQQEERSEECFLRGVNVTLSLALGIDDKIFISPRHKQYCGPGYRHKLHFYVIPVEKGRAGTEMLFRKILLCYIYCLLGTSLHFCFLILLPHDTLRVHSSICKFIIINKSSIFHLSPWYHEFQPRHLLLFSFFFPFPSTM